MKYATVFYGKFCICNYRNSLYFLGQCIAINWGGRKESAAQKMLKNGLCTRKNIKSSSFYYHLPSIIHIVLCSNNEWKDYLSTWLKLFQVSQYWRIWRLLWTTKFKVLLSFSIGEIHPGLELELSGKKIPCYTIHILPQKNARCRLCT